MTITTDNDKLADAQLTWYECSEQLMRGDRVRFVEDFDICPYCVVRAGSLGTVIENGLNEITCGLLILPDDRELRLALGEWHGEVQLGYELNPDLEWQAFSPLSKVGGSVA